MNRNVIVSSSIFFLFLIFFGINGISDKIFSRFQADLTEEGLYTLSKGSKSLVSKLQSPITLKFYYSREEGDNYPLVKLYGARLSDLIKEYERVSSGKITVDIIDPKPDSEDEEWAEKYGVTPLNLPTGGKLFLGLVAINGEGKEANIPAFDVRRQEYLEYDITKLLYSLDTKARPVVGILSPLEIAGQVGAAQGAMFGQPAKKEKPWILYSQLSKMFDVKILPLEAEFIPEEINLLFIVHPRGFSEKLNYAIDQFVMKGGNLFIAEDTFAMSDMPPADPSNPMANFTYDRSSNLNSVTEKWGFKMVPNKVVTDRYLATPVAGQDGRTQNFIAWLSILAKSSDKPLIGDDVITNNLENIMLAWAGGFEVSDKPEIKKTILLQTTEDSMSMDEKNIRFSAENPKGLLEKHVPGGSQIPLAIKLTGVFESSFSQPPAGIVGGAAFLSKATKPASIVAISDVDFMADDYSAMSQNLFGTDVVNFLNDNQTFALNGLDNLSGNADLIALRSRGKFTRPFSKVQMIEAQAQDQYKDVEKSFQAALDQANERLSKLQSGVKSDGKSAVTNEALLGEIKTLREEKRTAQRELRKVRLKLRENKENLGSILFAFNTFFVPFLLVVFYAWKNYFSNQTSSKSSKA